MGATKLNHLLAVFASRPLNGPLGSVMGSSVPKTDDRIRLGAFLTLDDIELDLIVLFQCFVSIQLNRRVVNEYVGPIFAADEPVALGVIEPLDLTFVLSHRIPPFLASW